LIREKLADKLFKNEVYDNWIDIFRETNLGNYEVEDIEVTIDYNDTWVVGTHLTKNKNMKDER